MPDFAREDLTLTVQQNGIELRLQQPQFALFCEDVNYSSGRWSLYLADGKEVQGTYGRVVTPLQESALAAPRTRTTRRRKASKKAAKKAAPKRTSKKPARKASKKTSKPKRRR